MTSASHTPPASVPTFLFSSEPLSSKTKKRVWTVKTNFHAGSPKYSIFFVSLEGGLIIDVTRCSVALVDPADLMEAFQLLTSQESQDKLKYKIVRYKNKFEPKSTDTFKNIMVNALVRGEVVFFSYRLLSQII